MSEGPQTLGRYELVAKLATGGMGEIFLARLEGRAGFEKLVVLKRLLPELAPTGQYVSMFFDEARLAARLSHPNVCEVHDLGEASGQYFIVMQYMEGVPFARAMVRAADSELGGHLRFVTGALAQACEGLHHAHELCDPDGRPLAVVHRDVSPSNLFVTVDGVVKVLDFGIAKAHSATSVTEKGLLKGKFSYMSPEQLADAPVDRRADVFCLGIVAWEAATGQRLFKRDTAVLAAQAILEDAISPASSHGVPAVLSDVIAKALERSPARRFATARQLGKALAEAATELGGAMTAGELASVVAERFGSELAEQRTLYRRSAAVTPVPAGPVVTPAEGGDSALTLVRPVAALVLPARASRGWLWLAAGVVGASALAVALWGSQRGHDAAPAPPPPAVASRPSSPALPGPAPPAGPAPVPAPTRTPAPAEKPHEAAPGFFSIDSTPYAVIVVDGRRVGDTPIIHHALAPGHHRLVATTKDGRKQQLTLKIEAGTEARPLQLTW